MTTRAEIVDEARRWIGTPYQHQGHTRGLACDCAGLVGGVCVALGLLPADWWETTGDEYAGYARTPANGLLQAACERVLRPIEIGMAQAGDAVLTRFSVEPQHTGILVPYRYGGLAIVHALSTRGSVVEHRLGGPLMGHVTAAYALPGVED